MKAVSATTKLMPPYISLQNDDLCLGFGSEGAHHSGYVKKKYGPSRKKKTPPAMLYIWKGRRQLMIGVKMNNALNSNDGRPGYATSPLAMISKSKG